jgi:uncharacterized membrane protein YjdF
MFHSAKSVRQALWRKGHVMHGLHERPLNALAFSALYEIIEWLASLSNPTDTEAFLGTQGYIWDTQSDMFLCLVGSVLSLILFTKLHNRYLSGVH